MARTDPCSMPTKRGSMCSRRAYVFYFRGEGTTSSPWRPVAQYCEQHYAAGGHCSMSRPRQWEVDAVARYSRGGRFEVLYQR
jgi:hypothetical protein